MSVTHLSIHSHYSLLNGIAQIEPIVLRAVECGMPAIALTDRNNLYGAIEFYKLCKKHNIKPIIGVDIDVDIDGRTRLVMLAENNEGYGNLIKLVSRAHTEHNGDPHATREMLEEYKRGLIVLTPEDALVRDARNTLNVLTEIFDRENLFIRIGWNSGQEERKRTHSHAHAFNIPVVAGEDIYYLNPEDQEARDIVKRIGDPSATPDEKERSKLRSAVTWCLI